MANEQPYSCNPLNITFRSDMPITLPHPMLLMSKIYVVNSDMKNVRISFAL